MEAVAGSRIYQNPKKWNIDALRCKNVALSESLLKTCIFTKIKTSICSIYSLHCRIKKSFYLLLKCCCASEIT